MRPAQRKAAEEAGEHSMARPPRNSRGRPNHGLIARKLPRAGLANARPQEPGCLSCDWREWAGERRPIRAKDAVWRTRGQTCEMPRGFAAARPERGERRRASLQWLRCAQWPARLATRPAPKGAARRLRTLEGNRPPWDSIGRPEFGLIGGERPRGALASEAPRAKWTREVVRRRRGAVSPVLRPAGGCGALARGV